MNPTDSPSTQTNICFAPSFSPLTILTHIVPRENKPPMTISVLAKASNAEKNLRNPLVAGAKGSPSCANKGTHVSSPHKKERPYKQM